MGRLDGKVAIVTGAARGIGAAAARMFAREGAKVVLADMLEEPLQALAQEIGMSAAALPTDVSNEAAMERLVAFAMERFGRLDIALLNAGIAGEGKPITDYPAEMFDKIMSVNVRGTWLGLKYAMKAMEADGGSIIITSSTAGIRAVPNMSPYTASKHAVIGLMRTAALEGASKRIRVNTVNPAIIDTPLVQDLEKRAADPAAVRRNLVQEIPLGRIGDVTEVAQLMLFLASDDSSFCTGGVYMVDGGVSAGRIPRHD